MRQKTYRPILYLSLALNLALLAGAVCIRRAPENMMPEKTAQPFQWSKLEADNYPAYIANLREVGCPEATISSLITADLAAQNVASTERAIVEQLLRPPPGSSIASLPTGASAASMQDDHLERAFAASGGISPLAPSQGDALPITAEPRPASSPIAGSEATLSRFHSKTIFHESLTSEQLLFRVQNGAQAFAAQRDEEAREAMGSR